MKFPLRSVERQMVVDAARLRPEFAAFGSISLPLDEASEFWLRLQLEERSLLSKNASPGRARLAAARAAAQFIQAERETLSPEDRAALPAWIAPMAADLAPPAATLKAVAPNASEADLAKIRAVWSLLGTTESLMETGGDIRLETDPRSALNGYGCSHRPRPWAITFASSTASSSSARGYVAADKVRLRATAALLTGEKRKAVANALQTVRRGIARAYGLPPGAAVILAASGTDTELLALALTQLAGPDAPVRNILIAPEETGRGVPMAARGHHFAINTALGADVTFESPIEGFRADTELVHVPLRQADGDLRQLSDVEAEIAALVENGIAARQKILLHALDLSKTGLLAPSPAFLRHLRTAHGQNFDIVVDACQARLSPASVRAYLALNATVLITGSKFFTGPPFAGAALLPPSIAARLNHGPLPEGLDAYFGRDEFPPALKAAATLPPQGNFGLALRWHAALAEMRALLRVSPARRAEILQAFGNTVTQKIAAMPALRLLHPPKITRHENAETWELLPSIFTFSLRAPHAPERNLTPVEARAVYLWLNTDLSPLLPGHPSASRICHIGQPVKLPSAPGPQGVLRVSAGARLISGEPTHRALSPKTRLAQELADLATVFEKIALILANWPRLWAADPSPRYRPAVQSPRAKVN